MLPAPPSALRAALEHHATRFNLAMALLAAAMLGLELILGAHARLTGFAEIFSSWPGLLLLLVALGVCHWFPLPRFIATCEITIWAAIFSNLLACLVQIAGRSPCPLVDAGLASLDHAMHFDTATAVGLVARLPPLQYLLAISYDVVYLGVFVALMLPPFLGRETVSRRYLLGIIFGLLLTTGLFAIFPAIGPWTSEALRPTREQMSVASYLTRLKSEPFMIVSFKDAAIISFPSFHVILAILSAHALSKFRRFRILVWLIASLVCASTVTTGWHYGIDVLGGALVAVIALALARIAVSSLEAAELPVSPQVATAQETPALLPSPLTAQPQ